MRPKRAFDGGLEGDRQPRDEEGADASDAEPGLAAAVGLVQQEQLARVLPVDPEVLAVVMDCW